MITGLDLGGAEKSLLKILSGLSRDKYTQHVISLTGRGVYGGLVEDLGITLTCLDLRGYKSIFPCFFRLLRIIRAERPDIIHTWLYHADFLGLLASKLCGNIPIIWNIRCGKLEDSVSTVSTQILGVVLKLLSSIPRLILFNSYSGMESHIQSGYKSYRMMVIPNGFDLNEWKPQPLARATFCERYQLDESEILIGIVARYHKIKDHVTFLKAAQKLVSKKKLKIKFVMVGKNIDWGNQDLVSVIDSLGIREHILLLGPLTQLNKFMPSLDCLVLTSKSEGFPSVLAEALASGVPCVSTDVGDARIICGKVGYVVPVGEYKVLAQKIEETLSKTNDIGKDVISTECRAQIANNFRIEDTLISHDNLYKQIYRESNAA